MLKSYRVGGVVVVVAHKILLSTPVPWIRDLGMGIGEFKGVFWSEIQTSKDTIKPFELDTNVSQACYLFRLL